MAGTRGLTVFHQTAPRCKSCRRFTRDPDGYCHRHGPAGPHEYRVTRIYTHDGLTLRCREVGCEDDAHRVKAALGFSR
jgi:hypothetical protein